MFDDVDEHIIYWYHETLLSQIIQENAPLKHKTIRNGKVPYMHGKLRRSINYKNNKDDNMTNNEPQKIEKCIENKEIKYQI